MSIISSLVGAFLIVVLFRLLIWYFVRSIKKDIEELNYKTHCNLMLIKKIAKKVIEPKYFLNENVVFDETHYARNIVYSYNGKILNVERKIDGYRFWFEYDIMSEGQLYNNVTEGSIKRVSN